MIKHTYAKLYIFFAAFAKTEIFDNIRGEIALLLPQECVLT
jgi:hypothetical protein